MKLPFFQFYPSDYKRDTCALSLAAKGGWIDVLCMLHGAQNRGTMTLPPVGWARVMGSSVDQADAVIAELAAMRIAEVQRESNGDVTISSRRMLREHITREQTRLRVARHRGNADCNAARNDAVTDNKSEVRSQKSETNNKDVGQTQRRTAGAAPAVSDSEWMEQLTRNPAYSGINVGVEHGKMLAWCSAHRKQPTRRRFVNWLNRVERPMHAGPVSRPSRPQIIEPTGWKAHLNREYPDSVYSAGGKTEAHEWSQLPAEVQAKIAGEIRRNQEAA